jgi:mono/diheme cytochrome c family protein
MKRGWKIAGVVIVVLVIGVAALAVAVVLLSERKLHRTIALEVAPVAFANDAASIERGKYLYQTRGCADCHGSDGAGRAFIDDPGGLYVRAPNIATGPGTVVATYTERDWVRAIRHGVKPDGRPIIIMPTEDYNRLTDADLAAIVAYVRTLAPVAGEAAVIRMPFLVRALYAFDVIQDGPQKVDHGAPPATAVAPAPTAAYGAYVINACVGCHGPNLSGGTIPGAPPSWPAASNLTPGSDSVMPRYDSADKLREMFRTGKRPDGSAVSEVMPFEALRSMNDTDVGAIHAYLKTLPARPAGGR